MADAIVSSLFQVIFETLNSFIVQQFGSAWGLKKELKKLESTLSTIQAVIHDAEEKQTKSEAVKNWLTKLKEVAYDADDIVDEFANEALLQRPEIRGGAIKQVSNFFSLGNPLLFRYKMAQKINDVVERLDAIAKEKDKFHFREGGMMKIQISSDEVDRRQTSSFVTETAIYGRDEEKEMIIQQLVLAGVNREEDVSIRALVGMGGLGKTTLAQLIYNDERIDNHFQLKIWVCVSVDFNIKRLTKAIIESSGKTASDISELHALQCRLREILNAKKFLLVLDDVWNEDQEEWDKLKSVLSCGGRGSLIIVTTRSEKVASIMATVLPGHRLGLLSENDSWSLFRNRAFGSKEREEDPNLITVGRDILKKCGGLPLAIKAISGLLRFKMKESEWLAIKESETWEVLDQKSGILPSLMLSYNELPLHLRQCFAYCSIFPKDHPIKKEYLIQAWMANGFIPSKGQMDLEEIGEEVFNDLLWRSFFQEPSRDDLGNVIVCKMHDLMHDLALSVTRNECAMFKCDTDSTQKVPTGVRHLLLDIRQQAHISWNENLNKLQSLRSFHLLQNAYPASACIPLDILGKSSLRLLELRCSDLHKWPSFIHNCKHLRVLDLSYSNIKMFHESTTSLQNLQTLKLNYCQKLHKLPIGMRHMRNLRRLEIDGCYSLSHMPSRMGQLTGLRTLSTFIVGKDSERQIGELEDLNKLQHGIEIKGMYNVKSASDAKKADLMSKKNLESLTLTWRSVDPWWDDAFQVQEVGNNIDHEKALEEVLESLRPPTNLKTLGIRGYEGSKFPTWIADQLPVNLVTISLAGCGRIKYLNSLGRLPSLGSLSITKMNAVKVFWDDKELVVGVDTIIQEKSFPALKTLSVSIMPNLESWTRSEGREMFPCLEELSINNCLSLVGLPQSQTLKTLKIKGSSDSLLKSIGNLTSLVSLEVSNAQMSGTPSNRLTHNHSFLGKTHISLIPCLKLSPSKFDNLSNDMENLHPRRSGKLTYLPEEIRSLVCLESLEISDCDILSLPNEGLQGLRSLTRLWIQNCPELESLSEGVQYLTMLTDLLINGCPKITSLPEGMQHLTSLQRLSIWQCDGLSSLPEFLGNLASLSYLTIDGCKNITSLPEGLHHNTTLRSLEIICCPLLKQRYNKETGEDWHKIDHIPEVDIRDSWR